ncbi:unnamed protein product [Arabis nemorensis]|uniref:RING-type domain-containing protein n=1 Tax=Arabis nemorensis TaxID=586526 RepID=A0A565AS50_9BRAS|nr:unnamed protein product [Arabis nemorensis]
MDSDSNITNAFDDMEADFSPLVNASVETGVLYVAEPLDACEDLRNKRGQSPNSTSRFVLIVRGGCSFEYKVRNAQRSGFKAAIVHDNMDRNILIAMGGDPDGIKIQAVFVTKAAGEALKNYAGLIKTEVMLVPSLEDSVWSSFATIALMLSLATFVVLATCIFVYRRCITHMNATSQFHGMSRRMVKAMPSVAFICAKEDNTTSLSCAICLEDYSVGDKLRVLPCSHKFHAACVDSWLTSWRTFCPVCKRDARTSTNEPQASESTPFLRSSIAASSVVLIDTPPVGSSLSFSSGHISSSYIQQSFRSSSHHSRSSPINVSRISADLREQTSPLNSSSQKSYITCMGSLHSPCRPSPSNVSPGLVQSTYHQFHPLLCSESAGTLSPFASAHSLREC